MNFKSYLLPSSIAGIAYLSSGETQEGGKIAAYGLTNGRFSGGRTIGSAFLSEDFRAAPTGDFAIEGFDGARVLDLRRRTIRAIPQRFYKAISPNGRFVAAGYSEDSRNQTLGLAIVDTTTWRPLWKERGGFYPTWDRSGNHLIFFRFVDRGKYWSGPGFGFPPAFDTASAAYRRHHTHLYVVEATGHSLGQRAPRRISEAEAEQLIGRWFRPYMHICLDHDSLMNYAANSLLFAHGNQGVLITLSVLDEAPAYASDGSPMPPHPPEVPGDTKHTSFFIDASGHTIRQDDAVVEPVSWSRDNVHVYGRRFDASYDQDYRFCRLNVISGRLETIKLPPPYSQVVAFVEHQ